MLPRYLQFAVATAASVPALASSPDAWAALQAKAERACIQSSGLGRPRVSNPVILPDQFGTLALLVTGTPRRTRSAPASVTYLCLYDRRLGKAAVEEARGWSERPR